MQLGVGGNMRQILSNTYNQEGIVRFSFRHFLLRAFVCQGPVPGHERELHEGNPHDGHVLLGLRVNEAADGAEN